MMHTFIFYFSFIFSLSFIFCTSFFFQSAMYHEGGSLVLHHIDFLNVFLDVSQYLKIYNAVFNVKL